MLRIKRWIDNGNKCMMLDVAEFRATTSIAKELRRESFLLLPPFCIEKRSALVRTPTLVKDPEDKS